MPHAHGHRLTLRLWEPQQPSKRSAKLLRSQPEGAWCWGQCIGCLWFLGCCDTSPTSVRAFLSGDGLSLPPPHPHTLRYGTVRLWGMASGSGLDAMWGPCSSFGGPRAGPWFHMGMNRKALTWPQEVWPLSPAPGRWKPLNILPGVFAWGLVSQWVIYANSVIWSGSLGPRGSSLPSAGAGVGVGGQTCRQLHVSA